MTCIANNAVCAAETDRMTNILRRQSFSVYPDETSDRSHEKWLSLVVRYVNPLYNEIRVELLQLINVDSSDCSSEKIFTAFEGALSEKKIPISNVCAMSSNHAQVMLGKKRLFPNEIKGKKSRCACHWLRLSFGGNFSQTFL